jgi:pSer/pThr/pTyr-binding forkhead associated (FHA) protein
MPPQLRALSEGPDLLLDKPIILIGRYQECDIQIPSRKVSRRHCCIAQVNDHLVVRDLYSTNGVRINGVRVREGKLNGGDELTIANLRYQVCVHEAQKGPPNGKPAPQRNDESLESSEEPIALVDESFSAMPNMQIDDQPSGELNQSAF